VTQSGVQPDLRTVRGLLTEDHYRVPVYQRNYAWGEEEIRQLIDDLLDAATDETTDEYFLGNIVVSASRGSAESPFSVVDGQQRLTTLHLLFRHLSAPDRGLALQPLTFESRPRAARSLDLPGAPGDDTDPGITTGFRIISQYPRTAELARHLDYVLDKVLVVRLQLPQATDLNRYFEVMNTRGQQLQQHDIVKARLMARLPDDERSTFAWIWDACARMDTYIQMALTPGDPVLRGRLFGPDWAWLQAASFGDLLHARRAISQGARGFGTAGGSLTEAIGAYAASRAKEDADADEPERFSSVIEFPTFLLHVLRIVEGGEPGEDEAQLDDKKLVQRFQAWVESAEPAERVRHFAFTMLHSRLLFDTLVLKREFTSRTADDGTWSLKRLVKGISNGRATARYVGSFPLDRAPAGETESTDDADGSKRIRLLESALRVTYTSPRTMHWMTEVLRYALGKDSSQLSAEGLLAVLQGLARAKVADVYDASGAFTATGFGIPRIVFTYLDYLLADRAGQLDFQFTFRNSVEHFYPQHPDDEIRRAYGALSNPGDRELLGNLALVTVRDNSKFTNNPPFLKAQASRVVAQSPKLGKMAEVAERDHRAWDSVAIHAHHKEMLDLLREDLFVSD
jgi:hypothetical protein